MKIGIITYDVPHLKTQQVFFRLIEQKYQIYFFFSKFTKFKERRVLHYHRPFQFSGPDLFELSRKYKIKTNKIEDIKKIKDIRYYLICGSGIIDNRYILKNKFINCHPGLIPMSRGLDSFKWSILNNQTLGNTLHFIDKEIDSGKIIYHKKTPIFESDNYQLLAKRHYDMEIDMLVNFEKYIKKPIINKFKIQKPNMRMPIELENKMLKKFENYKKMILKLKN
tara:strand:+ start:220 stop:888 length:669 start_codon:yes stop_codon:yes gene_type:complete